MSDGVANLPRVSRAQEKAAACKVEGASCPRREDGNAAKVSGDP